MYNSTDLKSLLGKKEFFSLKRNYKTNNLFNDNEKNKILNYYNKNLDLINLYSYQKFIVRYINIFTPFKRLAVKWGTGSGKTKAALAVAHNFLKQGGKKVLIVGSTKSVFINELLTDPYFDIVNDDLVEELRTLKNEDFEEYKYLIKKLTKMITNFGYEFIGYRKLFDELFIFDEVPLNNINLVNIHQYIKKGTLSISKKIDDLENTLIILDESHRLYNSKEKNNYGVAVEYILSTLKDNVYCLLLSATLLNNDPSEIIEIAGLLNYDFKEKKEDYFTVNDGVFKLKPNALKKLEPWFYNKVSYLETRDEALYPKQTIMGEVTKVPFLKFIKCQVENDQLKLYKQFYNIQFPTKAKYINDYVYKNKYTKADLKVAFGDQIKIRKDYFTHATPDIKNYAKGRELLKLLKTSKGKSIIYHKNINVIGVILIAELLRNNGYTEYGFTPNNNAISIDNKRKKDMKKDEIFIPKTFYVYTGYVSEMERMNILEIFNSESNAYGEKITILIGSSVIEASWDFKSVRQLYVMSPPNTPSNLIQLFGRGVRSKSHFQLKLNEREIKIYLLISGDFRNSKKVQSYELELYNRMMMNYSVIKQINNTLNKNAIDLFINQDIINTKGNPLGDDEVFTTINVKKFNDETFNLLYRDDEILSIESIIKSLFQIAPVWTFNDLFKTIKNLPVDLQFNVELIDKDNYTIALNNVVSKPESFQFTYIDDKIIVQKDIYYILTKNKNYNFLSDTVSKLKPLNLSEVLDYEISYEQLKEQFYKENRDKSILQLGFDTNKYSKNFYIKYIEEIIEYLFSVLQGDVYDERHEFILRILYFMDKFNLIIYASQVDVSYYNKYISESKEDVNWEYKTLLYSSLSNVTSVYPTFSKFDQLLEKKKVFPQNLPVGHFLDNRAKIYNLSDWENYIWRREKKQYINNGFIIGYLDKSTNLNFDFKLINPKESNINDLRKRKKGTKCNTIKRERLLEIIKELGIKEDNHNISNLCDKIKLELIKRELKEAKKKNNVRTKWFYFHFEDNPYL